MKNHVIVPGHTTLKSHSHFHQQHLDIRSITTSPELRFPSSILYQRGDTCDQPRSCDPGRDDQGEEKMIESEFFFCLCGSFIL